MHDQCTGQPKRWRRCGQALWRLWDFHRFGALIGRALINERAQRKHLRLNPTTSGHWLSSKTQGLALAFYGDAPEQFMQMSGTGNPTHEASMLQPVQASSGEHQRTYNPSYSWNLRSFYAIRLIHGGVSLLRLLSSLTISPKDTVLFPDHIAANAQSLNALS